MDHARPKSSAFRIKRAAIVAVALVSLIGGGVTLARVDFSSHRVDRTKLNIESVRRGAMDVKVSANGQLVARNIEQIVAQVSGRVSKTYVKPGDSVEIGQTLVELTNPQSIASSEEAYSAWQGAVADEKATVTALQSQLLTQETIVSQAKLAMDKEKLELDAESHLTGEHIIPDIDFKRTTLNVEQLTSAFNIEKARLQSARDNMQAQIAVKAFRVSQLARVLERAKSDVDNLKIVAGITGVVQTATPDVGQQLEPGSPVGRIAQQDNLYAELKVPAREAGEVSVGQNVVVDTRNGTVNATVTRIDPSVTDGTVTVEADINEPLPRGARPQLQIEGVIYITQVADTLYVGKPSYVKSDATIAVYKLDAQGHYASRVMIRVGKISLNYVQVLEGLSLGDRIITSEIDEWRDQSRILLN
jgi:HlyD family secretion protein